MFRVRKVDDGNPYIFRCFKLLVEDSHRPSIPEMSPLPVLKPAAAAAASTRLCFAVHENNIRNRCKHLIAESLPKDMQAVFHYLLLLLLFLFFFLQFVFAYVCFLLRAQRHYSSGGRFQGGRLQGHLGRCPLLMLDPARLPSRAHSSLAGYISCESFAFIKGRLQML